MDAFAKKVDMWICFCKKVDMLWYNVDMYAKDRIYQILEENEGEEFSTLDIADEEGTGGRSYVSRVLNRLVREGKVQKIRRGKEIYYKVDRGRMGEDEAEDGGDKIVGGGEYGANDEGSGVGANVCLDEDVILRGLHEDEVWKMVKKRREFWMDVPERAENILYFGFTEMLNNAIDHSKSGIGHIRVERGDGVLRFVVRDRGVGVFRNVMTKRGLNTEVEAIQELVKGRVTTAPKWHSGEGIFWTSKVADYFALRSYGYALEVDNRVDDYAIRKLDKSVLGTEVRFEIGVGTKKSLQELFRSFAFDDRKWALDATVIPIKLYEEGEVWISRSQAKKIMVGLDKYKKIIFDFKGIEVVGQAFCDEIFRVWRREHPDIVLETRNMNEVVRGMVEGVRSELG